MAKRRKFFTLDEALKHPDHHRPRSRREFLSQGFCLGGSAVLGGSMLSLLSARANAISGAGAGGILEDYYDPATCKLGAGGSGRKIPFICFDLAGGANISGSNVLVGGPGGQRDPLSTAGYSKLGIQPDFVPTADNPNSVSGDFTDDSLGLLFHSESAMLEGIKEKCGAGAQALTNGAIIPGRSDNDTGNNPHNPMYGIYQAGLRGNLLQLIGSESSVSGGNSMAPAAYFDPEIRPTRIVRPDDAAGLVDVGDLSKLLTEKTDVVAVMEAMKRITDQKLNSHDSHNPHRPALDDALKNRISCEYIRSADALERYVGEGGVNPLDPREDPFIQNIFSAEDFDDREFAKTAAIMKLVIGGDAGAGTIEMGGYDYHTGDRSTGEARDLRAGRCIGACIQYAIDRGTPLMIYVFSDGSVASNGSVMPGEIFRGIEKGVWTGDNSSTGASFFLVIDPTGRPSLRSARSQQLGYMRPDASVETGATPGANSVTSLVDMVILNYMALHGDEGGFAPSRLGVDALTLGEYIAFDTLSSMLPGGILPPVTPL